MSQHNEASSEVGREIAQDRESQLLGDGLDVEFDGSVNGNERYRKYNLQRQWVKEQQVNMSELKYFQNASLSIDAYRGEPLDSLARFHDEFDQLFLAAINIPDFWLINIIQSRLEKAARDWAIHFIKKKGVQNVSYEVFWRAIHERFPVENYKSFFFRKLLKVRQKEDESVLSYGSRIEQYQLDTDFLESELRFIFWNGLKSELQSEIERKKGEWRGMTLWRLKDAASRIETMLKLQEDRRSRDTLSSESRSN